MLNMMKADLQRVFRGKGIYMTLGVLLLVTVLSLYGGFYFRVIELGDSTEQMAQLTPTGANMAFYMMESADNIFFVMLPIIIFIASADFSSGAVKNVLSGGISRVEYYFSKLILASALSILIYCLYIFISIFGATIRNGFGGTLDIVFVLDVLKPFLAQVVIILSVTSVGIFLVFTTKKTAAVNGAYLAFLILPMILFIMLFAINEKFLDLLEYDLTMIMRSFAHFSDLSSGDITKSLLIGLGYILVSTISGITLFSRCEVK